eukprot:15378722-Alexandrium_andersonii.AAC.1
MKQNAQPSQSPSSPLTLSGRSHFGVSTAPVEVTSPAMEHATRPGSHQTCSATVRTENYEITWVCEC